MKGLRLFCWLLVFPSCCLAATAGPYAAQLDQAAATTLVAELTGLLEHKE